MGQPHVVIFPYDEQGHVTPAFALGRALASRGIRVTCALSTSRFAKSSHGDHTSLLQVAEIPDGPPHVHGDDVCFQHSLQRLEPGLKQLLLGLLPRPSCLISDMLYPWSQDLADTLSLPRFQLCVFPATSFLLNFHLHTFIAKGLLPFRPGMEDEVIDFIPGLVKGFRMADYPLDALCRDKKQLEVWVRFQMVMKRGAGLVINTVRELELDALNTLSGEGISVYAIGPMANLDWSSGNHVRAPSTFCEDEECLLWLDKQRTCSVVYVAFGSMISLSDEEIHEIAFGLEACGLPFLWVLRSPLAMSALPVDFLERTKEKGRVISWAPQTAVLSHSSVGCFLFHSGMGSVLDALWAGMPMIAGFYKISDQNTIFKLITDEWKVAIAINDGHDEAPREGCTVRPLRHAVEKCVKEVVHGELGLELRRNVLKMKGMMRKAVEPGGCSYQDLSRLANELLTH